MLKTFRTVALLASALLAASSVATAANQLDEAMSADGLAKVNVKGVELAYAKPGASLAGYNKIKLDAVEVAFSKSWDPQRTGTRLKLSSEERENIRSGIAKLVHEEFVKALQAKDGYQITSDAGPEVLRVKVNVINVYVNAPDTMTAGRSRSYTVSAGEMTLLAELFDSESGAVIARVVDRREARNTGVMMMSSSVTNTGEARDIASTWARILRNGLDKAHGIGKK